MKSPQGPSTSKTLLERLAKNLRNDPQAWEEFVKRYCPVIVDWCRSWGLQPADALDVAQDVFTKLAQVMRDFTYDPTLSFRGWLHTITRRTWLNFCKARKRAEQTGQEQRIGELLLTEAAGEDFFQRVDREAERQILEEAKKRVQLRVQEKSWQAFCLTFFEEVSGSEAAKRLGMTIPQVYQARMRLTEMLAQEMKKLNGPNEDQGNGKP